MLFTSSPDFFLSSKWSTSHYFSQMGPTLSFFLGFKSNFSIGCIYAHSRAHEFFEREKRLFYYINHLDIWSLLNSTAKKVKHFKMKYFENKKKSMQCLKLSFKLPENTNISKSIMSGGSTTVHWSFIMPKIRTIEWKLWPPAFLNPEKMAIFEAIFFKSHRRKQILGVYH